MQLENGVLERTASVTALYIDSFVEPQIASLATRARRFRRRTSTRSTACWPRPSSVERVVSFRIWRPDGVIVYSPNRALIGQQFEPEGGLAQALAGEVSADMSDLSGPENIYERERWSRLVETYVPVRDRGGGDGHRASPSSTSSPTRSMPKSASARTTSWTVVALAALLSRTSCSPAS